MNSGVGQATLERAVTNQEPSLEVIHNNSLSTRDIIDDVENMLTRIEDFLNGPRPEKDQIGAESCPSGILAAICQQGTANHDRLGRISGRISRIATNLGVS